MTTRVFWSDLPKDLLGVIKLYAHVPSDMLTINRDSDWEYFRCVCLPRDKVDQETMIKVIEKWTMLVQIGNLDRIQRWIRFWKLTSKDGSIEGPALWQGWNPLIASAACGHLQVFRFLVKTFGLSLDEAKTCFLNVAAHGHLSILQDLVETFPLGELNVSSDRNWMFVRACQHGHLDVVRFMWNECGLTIDDIRAEKTMAIGSAALHGHLSVVQFLVHECGLTTQDIRSRNDYAIRGASRNGHSEVVHFLAQGCPLSQEELCHILDE